MADTSQRPGWWLASDGRWYPAHLHPEYVAPTLAPAKEGVALTQPDPRRVCTNGHDIADGNQFCGTCGMPVGENRPVAGESDGGTSTGRSIGRKAFAYGSVALLAVIALIAVLIGTSGSPSKTASALSPQAPGTTQPPVDTCAFHLSNWVIAEVNSDTGISAAEVTFGLRSAIFQWLTLEQGSFQVVEESNGQGDADTKLEKDSLNECLSLVAQGTSVGEIPPPPSPGEPAPVFNGPDPETTTSTSPTTTQAVPTNSVSVPNTYGMSPEQAETTVRGVGLVPVISTNCASIDPANIVPGEVIQSAPSATTAVPPGSTVSLLVCG